MLRRDSGIQLQNLPHIERILFAVKAHDIIYLEFFPLNYGLMSIISFREMYKA